MRKILTINDALELAKQVSDPIILTGGCFDVLHPGHLTFLSEAKKIGGVLIVLLESDEKIKTLKGNSRPIHTQNDRAHLLSHLDIVDYVILLPFFSSDNQYAALVTSLHPQYFAVTKNDPVIEYIRPQAKKINAEIIEVVDRLHTYSTSNVVKKLNT